MELVVIQNRSAVTSSLVVADSFEKQHKDVLEKIDNLIKGLAEKSANLFYESEYEHPQNKQKYRMFYMNKKGFNLLAMRFTGDKALKYQLAYTEAFEEMEEKLKELDRPSYQIEDEILRAERWIEEQKEKKELLLLVEENKEKVLLADAISGSEDSISIKSLAGILTQNGIKTGQNKLFQWLRNNGYLFKSGEDKNLPMQVHLNSGLFEIKLGSRRDSEGNYKTTKKTVVTSKGQKYFIDKFLKFNLGVQ